MIRQDDVNVTDQGNGYVIGELRLPYHPKMTYLKESALICKFDGLDNMLDYITKNMPTAKREKSSADVGRGSFHAFDTYDEAMGIFRTQPQKVVDFNPAELRIKDANEAGSQVDYDVVGDYIDMGRYMEGIPEVMGSMHNGNARNRRVNMVINLNQIHYISHEDIRHRSERILRLVDALEAGGVRTQLVGVENNECGHTEVILKRHEEPLTITDLAVVTHPEFLRRIIFRVNEHSKTWGYGYGSAIAFSEKLTPELIEGDNVNELDIVIDANMSGKQSIDNAFDQIERLLVWEMSKPVPEVSSIKLDKRGIWFNPNGARSNDEIRREGMEIISAK